MGGLLTNTPTVKMCLQWQINHSNMYFHYFYYVKFSKVSLLVTMTIMYYKTYFYFFMDLIMFT